MKGQIKEKRAIELSHYSRYLDLNSLNNLLKEFGSYESQKLNRTLLILFKDEDIARRARKQINNLKEWQKMDRLKVYLIDIKEYDERIKK